MYSVSLSIVNFVAPECPVRPAKDPGDATALKTWTFEGFDCTIGTTNPTTRACALCFPRKVSVFPGRLSRKQEEEEEDKDKEEEEGRARASRRVDVQNLCRFFSREECGQKEASLFFYFTTTLYTHVKISKSQISNR